ncbi:MAG: hypothetical protein J5518_07955 [Lachnospiraceae bacterium]|nr:hypothetical protein [Lachnospiraceae bacterium]
MLDFMSLAINIRGLVLLWNMINILLLIYDMLLFFRYGGKEAGKGVATILLLFSSVLLYVLRRMHHHTGFTLMTPWIPLYPLLITEGILTILAVLLRILHEVWTRDNLTDISVKEAFDTLPTGLCYYLDEGMPKLINQQMDKICKETLHTPLRNGAVFADMLYSGEIEGEILENGRPIVSLPDGTVFSFQKDEIEQGGTKFNELIATDITEEYRLSGELEVQQKKARQVNTRLKSLLDTIEYVTMSKELLQFKKTLHDNIGRSLLLAKRWLVDPALVEKDEMLDVWRSNIRYLINDEPESWQIPYFIIEKQAVQLGIDLVIDGKLPEEDTLITLVDTAIYTHMTNVLRHAEGTRVFVKVTEEETGYKLVLTNDGKAPEHVVEEHGGLSNLRREIEAAGGRMEILSAPGFRLILTLPKGRKEDQS